MDHSLRFAVDFLRPSDGGEPSSRFCQHENFLGADCESVSTAIMANRGWPIDPCWSILLPGRPWVPQDRLLAWCVRMSEGGYLEDALEMHEAQHRILVELCPGGRFQGYRKLLSHLPSAGLNHLHPDPGNQFYLLLWWRLLYHTPSTSPLFYSNTLTFNEETVGDIFEAALGMRTLYGRWQFMNWHEQNFWMPVLRIWDPAVVFELADHINNLANHTRDVLHEAVQAVPAMAWWDARDQWRHIFSCAMPWTQPW